MITAICAEQGMAMIIIVPSISFSLRDSMTRVAKIAGTLQPMPTSIGIIAWPCSPILCITPSRSTTTRGR
jgi:hypothetical protein